MAERVLERCIYLGDSLDVPDRPELLHMRGSLDELGLLAWFDRGGNVAFEVNWSDLIALEVHPANTPGEEISISRHRVRGPFGWFTRTREAVLCVRATWGCAQLLVGGLTPAELDAVLAPLRAYIGVPGRSSAGRELADTHSEPSS